MRTNPRSLVIRQWWQTPWFFVVMLNLLVAFFALVGSLLGSTVLKVDYKNEKTQLHVEYQK